MSEFVINAIDRRETTRLVVRPDHYTLTPEKGWVWVQKACIWALRKIGALAKEEKLSVRTVRIETDDVVKALFKQKAVIDRFNSGTVSTVYIGLDEFKRLMMLDPGNTRFHFQAEYYRNRSLIGLKCEVIPWMEGILIV